MFCQRIRHLETYKRFFILWLCASLFMPVGAWGTVVSCREAHKGAANSNSEFLRPKKTRMSRSFFRSTYDYQVIAKRNAQGVVQMGLAKRVSLRELVKSDYDHGDFIAQIRTPKNATATEMIGVKSVRSAQEAQQLLDQMPVAGGLSNQFALRAEFHELFEILHFVFSRYKAEKDWPDAFFRDLARWSFRYFFQSTYIVIRKKTADGKPGEIVGTVRLISAPYKNDSVDFKNSDLVILAESSNWNSVDVRSGTEFIIDNVKIPDELMNTFWKDLFPERVLTFSDGTTSVKSPETITDGAMTYVLTPMESVLNQKVKSLRADVDQQLRNLIEPGNFSIDRLHADAVAQLLYMHMARLSQSPHVSQSLGTNSKSVTYAERRSQTHRYYQSLGLGVLPEKLDSSPTTKPWDILGGGPGALLNAFKKRFAKAPELASNIDTLLQEFDQKEQSYWIESDRTGGAPGGRNLGFTSQLRIVTPVEALFPEKEKK